MVPPFYSSATRTARGDRVVEEQAIEEERDGLDEQEEDGLFRDRAFARGPRSTGDFVVRAGSFARKPEDPGAPVCAPDPARIAQPPARDRRLRCR
jgi:hypothetical protein